MSERVDPAELLGSLAEGFLGSRCLHVAVNLGLADAVTDEPRSVADVAEQVGADAGALGRVVRHLAALGVFACAGERIGHNDASRLLRADDPGGLAPLIRMLGLPVIWESVGHLEEAVRRGRPGTSFVDPEGFFSYLDGHPEESQVYDEGMSAMTLRRVARMVPRYDFTPFGVIADIGGGRGHLLRAVLEQTPGARGVLFDRAQVVGDLPPDPRIEVQAGSFFTDPLPQADCYLLSNVVHDWSDEDAVSILTAVRASATPSSVLLLFEFVIPDGDGDFEATDIDVSMLALVGGRERTLGEYSDLLARSGWRITGTVPTPVHTIIEAGPAQGEAAERDVEGSDAEQDGT
ncbi:methyltransferase [Intrasporangium sp. DVR]|uniref:methyltransferase n=1 Tax=Intrasporangium sp. DVR TaxID=3127867 RepID=UPI00313A5CAF